MEKYICIMCNRSFFKDEEDKGKQCLTCRTSIRSYSNYYYAKDPQKTDEEVQAWKAKNPLKKQKKRTYIDPEKIKEHKQEYKRKWYAKNRDKINQYTRKYKAKNRDKINQYTRKYKAKNRDKVNEYQRKWYAKNPDKVKESRIKNSENRRQYNREYYAKNKEKLREYYAKNKEKFREYRIKNLENRRQYNREYYAKNKEKFREYRIKNLENQRQYNREYYAKNKEKLNEYQRKCNEGYNTAEGKMPKRETPTAFYICDDARGDHVNDMWLAEDLFWRPKCQHSETRWVCLDHLTKCGCISLATWLSKTEQPIKSPEGVKCQT